MKIDHLSLWTKRLEVMKDFYLKYFDCEAGEKYENPAKRFSSYFITFKNGGRIELMNRTDIYERSYHQLVGYNHMAIAVGSKTKVDEMTSRFKADGFMVGEEPRTTGDGYYESVIIDPEGNKIELTTS